MGIATNEPEAGRKKTLQGKYAEFLGLPLTVELKDPLTFAIAHRGYVVPAAMVMGM
jgi:hypothetical protein